MLPYANEKDNDDDDKSASYYNEFEKKIHWYDRLLLSRELKVLLVVIVVAFLAPLLLYNFLMSNSLDAAPPDQFSVGSCLVPSVSRVDCGLGNISQSECHPQCCYDLMLNRCFHRLPSRFSYLVSHTWNEELDLYPRIATEPFSRQIQVLNLRIAIDEISSTHLNFVLYDRNSQRATNRGARLEETLYTYNITGPELYIEVNGPQGTILSTIRGPLIAANNIWEMTLRLTNETMFGLGQIPLAYDAKKVIYNNRDNPDSIPLIYAKINESFHGFMIENDTPTEISILEDNTIQIRCIEIESLKFHLFVGPEPKTIMNDVMKYVGFKNKLEYWMLGPHICSEPSTTLDEAYTELNNFLTEAEQENIFFESHCGVAPVVFNTNCELDREQIHIDGAVLVRNNNKKFIPHLSPYFHYINNTDSEMENETRSIEHESRCPNFITDNEHLFLKENETFDIYMGIVDDMAVIYPDYEFIDVTTKLTKDLWPINEVMGGVLLQNNWPLDESFKLLNETYLELPYFSGEFEKAFNNTPMWKNKRPNNETYMYKHNTYGNNFVRAVEKITEDKIPVWSTSHWMNVNVIVNRQNVNTSWASLRRELVEASLGGISGHWLWTTPICGDMDDFNSVTQTSLCLKWYMAATYMPLIKIQSKSIPKHPLAFTGINRVYIMKALNNRMSLLPYFYTTLQTGPLLRPMFYQFPRSSRILNLTTQYSVGDSLLIVPNLLPMQSHVIVWMPPGEWYELWGGLKLNAEEGEPLVMTTTEADFLTLIQGGKILVRQNQLQRSAEETRLRSGYSITIALRNSTFNSESEEVNDNFNADGKLYLTNETSILFEATSDTLLVRAIGNDLSSVCNAQDAIWNNMLNEIVVYGLENNFNNHDNFKSIQTTINLCQLQSNDVIEFNFINSN